jgi:hypothetical protein
MLAPKVMNLGGFFSNSIIENLRSNTRVSKNSGSIGSDGEQQQHTPKKKLRSVLSNIFYWQESGRNLFIKINLQKN